MAVTQGVLVQYKTNNGSVPAVTLAQRDDSGAAVAIGSATKADLLILTEETKLYNVTKDSGTSESAVTTPGRFWVPA